MQQPDSRNAQASRSFPARTRGRNGIKVVEDISRDAEGRIRFRIFSDYGECHYKIWLSLDGADELLDRIDKVECSMGPPYKPPVKASDDRVSKFRISFWTSKRPRIVIAVYYKDGSTDTWGYYPKYRRRLPDGWKNYVCVGAPPGN